MADSSDDAVVVKVMDRDTVISRVEALREVISKCLDALSVAFEENSNFSSEGRLCVAVLRNIRNLDESLCIIRFLSDVVDKLCTELLESLHLCLAFLEEHKRLSDPSNIPEVKNKLAFMNKLLHLNQHQLSIQLLIEAPMHARLKGKGPKVATPAPESSATRQFVGHPAVENKASESSSSKQGRASKDVTFNDAIVDKRTHAAERPMPATTQHSQRVQAALIVTSIACLLHPIVTNGIPREPRLYAEELGFPNAGFELPDLFDGALTVAICATHMILYHEAVLYPLLHAGKSASLSLMLHTVLAGLFAIGAGGHMCANPLDEWLSTAHKSDGNRVAVDVYRTLYWQHELLCHKLFAFGHVAMWIHCAYQSEAVSPDHIVPWPLTRLLGIVLALLHGYATSLFWVGTRTVAVAAPLSLIMILFGFVTLIRKRSLSPVTLHAGVVSLVVLVMHVKWYYEHGESFPTFDDLRNWRDAKSLQDFVAHEYGFGWNEKLQSASNSGGFSMDARLWGGFLAAAALSLALSMMLWLVWYPCGFRSSHTTRRVSQLKKNQ